MYNFLILICYMLIIASTGIKTRAERNRAGRSMIIHVARVQIKARAERAMEDILRMVYINDLGEGEGHA